MKRVVLLLALSSLSAAQQQDPAYDPLEKAYQAIRSAEYSEAVDHLTQAVGIAPRRASIRKQLGHVYLKLNDLDAARRMFEEALSLDPSDHHTALQLGFVYQKAGETTQAIALFRDVRAKARGELKRTARKVLRNLKQNRSGPAGLSDPAYALLDNAYAALAEKDFEAAIHRLRDAVDVAPRRAAIRKELGYAYLKVGETEWAREMFEQVTRLDPTDDQATLELAFLSYETGQHARALELFKGIKDSADSDWRGTAQKAFNRIDKELRVAIDRWSEAVGLEPANWSAQLDLAELYEKHLEPEKAARHYEAAWQIQPPRREEILLQLARVRQTTGDLEGARGAWLLASRSKETRIAESARAELPDRHPYASEFRHALELDPRNARLRRELAYLLLEVKQPEAALREFEIIVEQDPNDLLSAAQLAFLYLERGNAADAVELLEKACQSDDDEVVRKAEEMLRRLREAHARPHRHLAEKSLQLSYLNEARRLFLRAYEANPHDHSVALKLGVVHNLMKRDREAIRWFRIASESPDPTVAELAQQSHRNLAPQFQRVTTTLWTYPLFSSRYKNLFQYAQLKTEFRLDHVPVRPYLSLRFVGDLRQRTSGPSPQFLSESSLIAGFGLRTPTFRGATLWAEAGEALHYLGDRAPGVPRAGPDYRGGLNWFRNFGATLGGGLRGPFAEINFDGVFISRFDNNVIGYWQFRPGYRLPDRGRLKMQVFASLNVTVDRQRAYWANFVEFGPGVRFRVPGVSPPMNFTIQFLRGVHLVNIFNPRRPNYYDIRAAIWYSFGR